MKLNIIRKRTFFTVGFLLIISLMLIEKSTNYTTYITSTSISCQQSLSTNLMQSVLSSHKKIAYLTFDDGPSPTVTPKILDILEEEHIKATFFVIGKKVKEHPELVKREFEDGHYIANHTYSHNNSFIYKEESNFISEIEKTEQAIGQAINQHDFCSHLFRFPNGFSSSLYQSKKKEYLPLLMQMEYSYIDWNCLTKDAEKKASNYQLFQNLKETSKGKDTLVILMHDTKDVNDSSLILKECISYLKSQGYEFRNFYDYFEI